MGKNKAMGRGKFKKAPKLKEKRGKKRGRQTGGGGHSAKRPRHAPASEVKDREAARRAAQAAAVSRASTSAAGRGVGSAMLRDTGLGRRLAHTDKPEREKAFRALSMYLKLHAGSMTRVDLLKIWKVGREQANHERVERPRHVAALLPLPWR